MNQQLQKDIERFHIPQSMESHLKGKRMLVTGATGLLGSIFVKCLRNLNLDIRFILPLRNAAKAERIFEGEMQSLEIIEGDLTEILSSPSLETDYIVHFASPTAGAYMAEHPAETLSLAFDSTRAALGLARRCNAAGMVYISSMEYYGVCDGSEEMYEENIGKVDMDSPRSSYPIGKRVAEFLTKSYAREYGVNAKIARLTQTFGAGIAADDNRVFAQFARSIIANQDIILHTTGESSKPYCYTTDCVSAILHILLRGVPGEDYNVANSATYISIRSLAEFLRDNFNPAIKVTVEPLECGYAPVTKVKMPTAKLEALGWHPEVDLREMFARLIHSIQ